MLHAPTCEAANRAGAPFGTLFARANLAVGPLSVS